MTSPEQIHGGSHASEKSDGCKHDSSSETNKSWNSLTRQRETTPQQQTPMNDFRIVRTVEIGRERGDGRVNLLKGPWLFSWANLALTRGIDVVLNDESKRETPALVCFGDKQRFLGTAGAATSMMNQKNTISQIKRLIGRPCSDTTCKSQNEQIWSRYRFVITQRCGIPMNDQYVARRR
ncbi:hypothetical protein LXL04_005327 [Taraxacum kok-saghyz]